jgi:MFS family permease
MALHQSSVYAGTIAGGGLAGVMGQYYGWRSSFYLFGACGILYGLILLLFLREPARRQTTASNSFDAPHLNLHESMRNVLATVRELFGNPAVRILTAVFVGANFVAMIFLTWMPSFLNRKFEMSLAMAGLSGTAYVQIASVLGVISGGVLADRLASRYLGGRMMAQAGGLLLGVPFIFITGWTLSVPILILALVGFGYFKGIYDANIWASLHDVVRPERRASAVGFMNSIGWLGGGLAPVAIAAASERVGLSASISASSIIYLGMGLLLIYGIRRLMLADRQPAPAANAVKQSI